MLLRFLTLAIVVGVLNTDVGEDVDDEDEFGEMHSSSVLSTGNLEHSKFSGHGNLNVCITFSQALALSQSDLHGGMG